MVTARSGGASYLNRVELQNGCLSLGHANIFIPSTLVVLALTIKQVYKIKSLNIIWSWPLKSTLIGLIIPLVETQIFPCLKDLVPLSSKTLEKSVTILKEFKG